jgi:tetratricopeptide (TPR) repeat protein
MIKKKKEKKKKIEKTLFVLFFLICGRELIAQASLPRIDPSPEALSYARKKTPYSWRDMSETGLWASGVQNQEAYLTRIGEAVTRLQSTRNLPSGARERGEFALTFMYDYYLTHYDENQTRLDVLLENGTYNCVSSSVFYAILAVSIGLDAHGAMTSDHAFVTLNADGAMIDVETTNKYGFDPGSKTEFRDSFGRITGYAYVEPQNYTGRASINLLELVSLILSNRIALLERQSRFWDAAPLIADREGLLSLRAERTISPFFIDPSRAMADSLRAIGVQLENAGRDQDALAFMARASRRYPDDPSIQQLTYVVINNAVARHLQRKQVNEARDTLNAYAGLLNQENFRVLNGQILTAELIQRTLDMQTSNDADELLKRLDDSDNAAIIGEDRVNEIRGAILNTELTLLAREKGLKEAIRFGEASVKRYGRNAILEKNLDTLRVNRGMELHNAFAALWNSGKRDQARAFLRDALQECPGNRQLLQDWDAIN